MNSGKARDRRLILSQFFNCLSWRIGTNASVRQSKFKTGQISILRELSFFSAQVLHLSSAFLSTNVSQQKNIIVFQTYNCDNYVRLSKIS